MNDEKRTAIRNACQDQQIDKIVELANSTGGLLDDELRRDAWPLLLGVAATDAHRVEHKVSWQDLPEHRDEEQVQKDVDRAFTHYPRNESQPAIEALKRQLSGLIVRVLRTHRMLRYFQGYHDIIQVLLLVLGANAAYAAAVNVSLFRIRDYMLYEIPPSIKHLQLIPAILRCADPSLAEQISHTQPHFALSSTLTLYAHDITEYNDITRIFDFILAHEPVMAIYLVASVILSRRSELIEIPVDEPEMIHHTLSKLPQPLDLEKYISETLQLFNRFPPESLPGDVWTSISSSSVLKTSRSIAVQRQERDAQSLFANQTRDLWREELLQKSRKYVTRHKRPILRYSATVGVGLLSVWLRKSGYDRVILSGLWRMSLTLWQSM